MADLLEIEQAGFQNNFNHSPPRGGYDLVQLMFDEIPVGFAGGSDVLNDIDFVCPGDDGLVCFVNLGVGEGCTQRKPHDSADFDGRTFERTLGGWNPVRVDTNRSKLLLDGFPAKLLDLVNGGLRSEKGVVDN